jgi:hypothetical protein
VSSAADNTSLTNTIILPSIRQRQTSDDSKTGPHDNVATEELLLDFCSQELELQALWGLQTLCGVDEEVDFVEATDVVVAAEIIK